jgi:hypothetical protein
MSGGDFGSAGSAAERALPPAPAAGLGLAAHFRPGGTFFSSAGRVFSLVSVCLPGCGNFGAVDGAFFFLFRFFFRSRRVCMVAVIAFVGVHAEF